MDVDHHLYAGVVPQILLYGLAGAGVGAGVAGVVVDATVMNYVQPRLLEDFRQLVADTHNIELRVLRPVGVAGLIAVQPRLGVGLAGVGVDDQDLRLPLGQAQPRPGGQDLRHIHPVGCSVVDAEAPLDRGLQDFAAVGGLLLRGCLRLFHRCHLRQNLTFRLRHGRVCRRCRGHHAQQHRLRRGGRCLPDHHHILQPPFPQLFCRPVPQALCRPAYRQQVQRHGGAAHDRQFSCRLHVIPILSRFLFLFIYKGMNRQRQISCHPQFHVPAAFHRARGGEHRSSAFSGRQFFVNGYLLSGSPSQGELARSA